MRIKMGDQEGHARPEKYIVKYIHISKNFQLAIWYTYYNKGKRVSDHSSTYNSGYWIGLYEKTFNLE